MSIFPTTALSGPGIDSFTASSTTTEIVVGIDHSGAYRPVVSLLEKIGFPNAHLILVHAASERIPFAPSVGDLQGFGERYATLTAELGRTALQEATELFSSHHLPSTSHLTHGFAAGKLVEEADRLGADLIAVNATRKESVGASSVGSVSAALVVASNESILIAKGDRPIGKNFRAVFATDHSPFANRCLERFIELGPKGIAEILVLSAWQIDDQEAEILGRNLAMLGGDIDRWIEESVQDNNALVCKKLEAAGYRARSLASKGKPNDVIEKALSDVDADLLILGSQGSGAKSRASMGSVSMHQVLSGNYPVLIIRAKEISAQDSITD